MAGGDGVKNWIMFRLLERWLGAEPLAAAVAWGEPWDYEDDDAEPEAAAVSLPR
jgi:hypothetical protein